MSKACFISIEGGEGVGKSTQISKLAEKLRGINLDVIVTREPGGTPGAEAIRNLLLDGSADRWEHRTEALLFAAARADHVARLIRPALEQGRWVISDRFIDSSRAYQGQGDNGITDDDILSLHKVGSDGIMPDRTLILTLDSEEASKRAADRDGGASDRIQARDDSFHKAVHDAFQRYADEEPERVKLINAGGSADDVTQRIMAAIADLLT